MIVQRLGVQQQWLYVALGCLLWLMLHEAGLNATLAGVAMGLLAPSTPRIAAEFVDVEELANVSTVEAARTTTDIARGSVSVVEWLQHVLHPWASYVIVPLFALANTGVTLSTGLLHAAIRSPITWAIIVGRCDRQASRDHARHEARHRFGTGRQPGSGHRPPDRWGRHVSRHGLHRGVVHHGARIQ